MGVLDKKTENKIYKQLDKLDEKVGKLIQIYCVIELDELYEIYKKLYQKKQGKKNFSGIYTGMQGLMIY